MAPIVNPEGNEVGKSLRECTTISTLAVNKTHIKILIIIIQYKYNKINKLTH